MEPGAARFVPDQIEALIELGRRDEAVELSNGTRATRGGSSAPPRWRTARAVAVCSRRRQARSTKPWRTTRRRSPFIGRSSFRSTAVARFSPSERPNDARSAAGGACDARGGTRCLRANRRGALGGACARRAEADQRPRCQPGALTPSEERVAALVAEGEDEPRGRRGALPVRADGRRSSRTCSRSSASSTARKSPRRSPHVKHRGWRGQLQGVRPFQRGRSLPSLRSRWSERPPD